MRRPHFIAVQSRCPTGWLGRFIGSLMARETDAANAAALSLLGLTETDRVLDVGCGPGTALARAARVVVRGTLTGVDMSEEMLRLAAARCRHLMDTGRLELRRGDVATLPYPAGAFDKILSVHTIYFWPDIRGALSELRRVLASGGRLVLGFRSRADPTFVADFPASVYRFYDAEEVRDALFDTGFASATITMAAGGVVLVQATRAAGDAPAD